MRRHVSALQPRAALRGLSKTAGLILPARVGQALVIEYENPLLMLLMKHHRGKARPSEASLQPYPV